MITENVREVLLDVCDHVKCLIKDGACDHLSAGELETWMKLNDIDEYLSASRAAKELGVSMNRFYDLRKAGIIPEPVKFKGLPKPVYAKSDIDGVKRELSRIPEHELRVRILAARAAGKKERRMSVCEKFGVCRAHSE